MTPQPGIYLTERHPESDNRELALQVLEHLFAQPTTLAHHPSGAPFLPEHPEYTISISHSRSLLALALVRIKEAPLGIDVEEKEAQAERLLPRYSSDEERLLLQAHQLKGLHLWCAKEAVYKAYSEQVAHFTKQIKLVAVTDEGLTLEVRPGATAPIAVSVCLHQLKGGALLAYTALMELEIRWL